MLRLTPGCRFNMGKDVIDATYAEIIIQIRFWVGNNSSVLHIMDECFVPKTETRVWFFFFM